MFQTSESCIKLHAVVVLELLLSKQCPLLQVCVCVSTAPGVCVCVCPLLQVCGWVTHLDGSNAENNFTAGYTMHNYVKIKTDFFFFTKPITLKCLNIGKYISKPIYRSISSL